MTRPPEELMVNVPANVKSAINNALLKTGLNQNVIQKPQTRKCQRCKRTGHYASNCYAQTDTCCNHLSDTSEDEEQEGVCYRCGRGGHYSSECYAKTNANGKYLS
jgi:hypothetical protein